MKGTKLLDGKGVGGTGRVTLEMIKRIQNYHGFAIRQNSGNLEGMRRAVRAISQHIVQDPNESLEVKIVIAHKVQTAGVGSGETKQQIS